VPTLEFAAADARSVRPHHIPRRSPAGCHKSSHSGAMSVNVSYHSAQADDAPAASGGSVPGTCEAGLSGEGGSGRHQSVGGAKRGMQPNMRMQLAGASVQGNAG